MYGPKKLYKCFVKGTQEVPLRASPTTTTGPGATEGVLKGGLTFERLAEEDDTARGDKGGIPLSVSPKRTTPSSDESRIPPPRLIAVT